MKRRFLALQIISIIYKVLALLAFIGMIVAIVIILIDAVNYPTVEAKLPSIGAALAGGIVGGIVLLAMGQLLDLLMSIEVNTRATNLTLQRMGRVMQDRL